MSAVTRILSPTDWVKRQIDTLEAVGETNYSDGIKHPRKDPIAAGIAAEGKYADAMKKVIAEKRRAEGLEKTSMSEWYAYADHFKGRLVDGVVARKAKVTRFVTAFQPLLTEHVGKIDAMPDVTDANREARMLANLRGLRTLKGKA